MDEASMRDRTKSFAKRIIQLCKHLPNTREARLIGDQVFRSGTSVGANYRAATRGRSRPDFISKLRITREEADDTLYWLELLAETQIVKSELLKPLMLEANELVSILVASLNTAKSSPEK
jgi:four helix bundle protein